MSAHFRSLLLAVAAVLSTAQSASACGGCLLLSPFRWLFGCDHYCRGPIASPHNCNRIIDDWLGYGYLRNQQGTLGHYPGNWYRQIHPLHHRPLQSYPAIAGGYGMPGPAMMVQPAPAAPIYNPSWNPCCDPSAGVGLQAPVAMQPPMMYPQPWATPVPVMPGPAWNSGDCCDPCGGSTVMYGTQGPAQMIYDGSSESSCGCSGGNGAGYMQPSDVPPVGMLPQQPVSWQQSGWQVGGWQAVPTAYRGYVPHASPQPAAWTPNTAWQQHQSVHMAAVAARPMQGWTAAGQSPYVGQAQTWAVPQPEMWGTPRVQQTAWGHPAQLTAAPFQQAPYSPPAQYAPAQYALQQPQPAWSQMPGVGGAPGAAGWQTPAVPVQYQNQNQYQLPAANPMMTSNPMQPSASARLPIRRVSLASPPLGAAGSRNYPNALR